MDPISLPFKKGDRVRLSEAWFVKHPLAKKFRLMRGHAFEGTVDGYTNNRRAVRVRIDRQVSMSNWPFEAWEKI